MKYYVILFFVLLNIFKVNAQITDRVLMDLNKIKIHIGNYGDLATGFVGDDYGGVFEGETFIYSGGFYLAGKAGNLIWGNGVFQSDHNMADYLPGNVDSNSTDSKYKVYVIKSSDPDFGDSWQQWKQAVEIGAMFYDGDGDGIYNPVDKNGNGKWDENEDKPDIIGDYTAWCVFNDSKPSSDRNYPKVSAKGIEIKETVFAWDSTNGEPLSNTFFVRYVIENTGKFYETLDSVFFGVAIDPDLGINYSDDYTGSDTLIQSAYAYKKAPDDPAGYGENPPSLYSVLLQGPHVFIPNETYLDLNSNGIFDEDSDQVLDSAKLNRGELLGEKIVRGAKNLRLNSTTLFLKSWSVFGEPYNENALFNYLIGGRFGSGAPLEVRNFDAGNGSELGNAADTINPKFMFSGDPVNKTGWLCTLPWDYRMILSTGPFTLKREEPVEIIAAYVVGRGNDPINSVEVTKDLAELVVNFYKSNFTEIPVSIKEKTKVIQKDFTLYQNYPNPFNPSTTIKYSLSQIPSRLSDEAKRMRGEGKERSDRSVLVTLKVYDVLGREVATLVDEKQSPGTYSITFDASSSVGFAGDGLPSGIYFYKLSVGSFVQTRKMILLK